MGTELKSRSSFFSDTFKVILIASALAFFFRGFVAQAFKIPSESMMDTLLVGDHLLVDKVIYRFSKPKRKDIVVFKYPKDQSVIFIKRLIGLPGDTIELKGETLYLNSKALDEPYAVWKDSFGLLANSQHFGPVTVPEGNYFVMGDNRNHSSDSRFWGYLPAEDLIGKAMIIHWSWDQNWNIRKDRLGKLLY